MPLRPVGGGTDRPEILEFFMGIGVPIYEAYGMTEQTGVATAPSPAG